jgi:predicted DNA-binding transcriptional regulator YafY
MSKTSNALLMLFYLNNKNTYTKISELADYLEVSNREVRRYRDDLEMAGFSIEHKTGRYGGYLLSNDVVSSMNINHMKHVFKYYQRTSTSSNIHQEHMMDIINSLKEDQYIANHLLSKETIDKLIQINLSIKLRYKIQIKYLSSKGYQVTQIIEPYLIKNVRDIQYLFAMHEGLLKSYRIKNIIDLKQTDLTYIINHDIYQKEKHEQAYGVRRGDDKYTIRFTVKGRMNQFVQDIFKGHARLIDQSERIYEVETYDLHEITYPFLSLGASLKILSPQVFIDHYLKEIKKMKKNL